jgi:hypothetical protein
MNTIGQSLLAGTALALLMAAPALAQQLRGDNTASSVAAPYGAPDTDGWGWIEDPVATVENHQSTTDGDVWGYAGNEADVALGAASAGVALGNTASAVVTEDVSVQIANDQALDGQVESQAQAFFGEAGPVTTTATTYGNTFTAESQAADIGMASEQAVGAGILKSRALIEAGEYAESATGTATTGANTATLSAEEGYAGLEANQFNDAEVAAEVEIKAAGADVPAAVGTALAVINNADVGTYGDASLAGVQDNTGDGHASVLIQAQGAYAAVGTTTITGNNLNMLNEGGVGNFAANQSNSGDLTAQSVIDVGVFPGQSTATAVGIGNNASANTTGPASDIRTVQNNSGQVVGQALFTGDSGVSALSNATAYGNAATGTLCNCDGDMNAYNHQANAGSVRAHAYNLANDATVLTATSVAAGNTASYTVGSP